MLSNAARLRLDRELERLDGELLPAARVLIEEARGQGDMSQNPDVFLAMEAEGRLLARREEVVRALGASAGGVPVDVDRVCVGVRVVLDFGDGPEEFVFGSIEEQDGSVQVVTPASPLGQVLSGVEPGVTLAVPGGGRVTVLSVRPL